MRELSIEEIKERLKLIGFEKMIDQWTLDYLREAGMIIVVLGE